MVAPPPSSSTASNLLNTQSSLIQTLCSFLTVSIHQILYLRSLYPRTSFQSTRAYNFPAQQNRHPAVCGWINSAVDAIRDQLEKNTVKQVAICVFEVEKNAVLEKWTFDLSSFPVVEKGERDTPFQKTQQLEAENAEPSSNEGGPKIGTSSSSLSIRRADLEAQFRAVLSRISSASTRLSALPKDVECSFTVSIQVRDTADRPVGSLEKEERKWIATEPEPWSDKEKVIQDGALKHGRTVPVRRLEAGELRIEVWVEESKAIHP